MTCCCSRFSLPRVGGAEMLPAGARAAWARREGHHRVDVPEQHAGPLLAAARSRYFSPGPAGGGLLDEVPRVSRGRQGCAPTAEAGKAPHLRCRRASTRCSCCSSRGSRWRDRGAARSSCRARCEQPRRASARSSTRAHGGRHRDLRAPRRAGRLRPARRPWRWRQAPAGGAAGACRCVRRPYMRDLRASTYRPRVVHLRWRDRRPCPTPPKLPLIERTRPPLERNRAASPSSSASSTQDDRSGGGLLPTSARRCARCSTKLYAAGNTRPSEAMLEAEG